MIKISPMFLNIPGPQAAFVTYQLDIFKVVFISI